MSHLILLPILIPAFIGALILLSVAHDQILTRIFSVASSLSLCLISVFFLVETHQSITLNYSLGDWPIPFGIVLHLDRLSAVMLTLSAFTGLFVLLYSFAGADLKGKHFHSLFQFQLMGINGAFLTGDLFNLFVFFEILLIASYGLMVHGGGNQRLKAGVQYVIMNLLGSALFLIGVGLIYGVAGTLNISDLALKVPYVAISDQALLQVGGLILLVVFSLKGALFPLHFWLPGTYSNTLPVVAGLFALLTKVGAYSIIRVYISVFGSEAGQAANLAAPWILPAAFLTLIIGSFGVFQARRVTELASFVALSSLGTLFIAIGQFSEAALSSALYYICHSTISTALFFLVAQTVIDKTSRVTQVFYFLAAIAVSGMPPLSGFLGKLLILDASRNSPWMIPIWTVILITSLIIIVGLARAGSLMFWKQSETPSKSAIPKKSLSLFELSGLLGLSLVLIVMTLFAGPIMTYMEQASIEIHSQRGGSK